MRSVLLFLLLAAIAGCSSTSHCRDEQDYQKAQVVPALKGVEGLKLPESASALRIPAEPENPIAFGEKYKDKDGDDAYRCLDIPPVLETADAPAPTDPVESAPAKPKREKPKVN